MRKNIISISIIILLVGIFIVTNFTNIGQDEQKTNIIDVTGDTSVEGGSISAPDAYQLKEGEEAPAFTLKNRSGEEQQAFNHDKPYTLVNFWATWCPPCVKEMPALHEFQQQNADQIQVVAVNVTNTETSEEVVYDFLDEGTYEYTILFDEKDIVYDGYSVINMPTSFLIRTSDRKILKRINGSMSLEQMQEHLEDVQSS
ncbi:TlpA family protein disulfide reductase [Gracilibacillus salinarum]|uniref:TlpA family protein disulfide reductase n=1 Tax=Gracilibacillus salinarum TaxID=2932255 RepID=A0ABY4GMW2_9BACI|nr:TlpA disulfide reductase family protein [Gracilibacillus salinarum]UOQ85721.1 TlpA family protein disulfide reductase [Gracilibacillus salinarum]